MDEASSPTPDRTDIVEEGALHHYRTEIPNTIIRGLRSHGLSVYAKWLYVYLKSVAGDGGICFRSTTTMAQEAGMSRSRLHGAKQELADQGLIRIIHGRNTYRDADRIRIKDIWPANMQEFSVRYKNTASVDEAEEGPAEAPNEPPVFAERTECFYSERGVFIANARRSPEEDPLKKKTSPPQTPPLPGEGPDAVAGEEGSTDALEASDASPPAPPVKEAPWGQTMTPAAAGCRLCDWRELVEVWQADGTPVLCRCPHDLAALEGRCTAHGYTREPPEPHARAP